jgi:hypothetical protein
MPDLKDLEYDEVSFVDKGANQDAHVVLFKRDTSDDEEVSKDIDNGDVHQAAPMGAVKPCAQCGAKLKATQSVCKGCGSPNPMHAGVQKVLEDYFEEVAKASKAPDDETDAEGKLDAEDDDESPDEDLEDEEADDNDEFEEMLSDGDGPDGEEQDKEGENSYGDDDAAEDEEEDEEDDEKDEDEKPVKKVDTSVLQEMHDLSALFTSHLAESIVKGDVDAIANAADQYAAVIAAAALSWTGGNTVSKNDNGREDRLRTHADTVISITKKQEDDMPEGINKSELSPEVRSYIEGLETQLAKKDETNQDEEIFKGMSPQAVEIVKKAQKDAEDTRALLAKRDDEQRTVQYVALAKSYNALPQEASTFGLILKRAAAGLPEEDFTELTRVLKAANAQVRANNGILSVIGREGGNFGDINKRLDAKVAELKKSDSKMTHEQAVAKAYDEDPSLYDEDSASA